MIKKDLNLGIDIGSISINTVLMDDQRNIIENRYDFCHGNPFQVLKGLLSDIVKKYSEMNIEFVK